MTNQLLLNLINLPTVEIEPHTDPGWPLECMTVIDTVTGATVDFRCDTFDGIMEEGWLLNRAMSNASARTIFHEIKHEVRIIENCDLSQHRDPATGDIVVPAHAAVLLPVFHRRDVDAAAALTLTAMRQNLI